MITALRRLLLLALLLPALAWGTVNGVTAQHVIAAAADGKRYARYPAGDTGAPPSSILAVLTASGWGQEVNTGQASPTINCHVPCAVFFDGLATVGEDDVDTFRQYGYHFDFGYASPSTPGTWTHSGDPKGNQVGGPLAAHVYQTAGTYTATLRVQNAAASYDDAASGITIVVGSADAAYPTTSTVCLTTDGSTSGCSTGGTYRNVASLGWPTWATNTRYLLKQTQDFTSAGAITINVSGVHIGRYGSGANPVVGSDVQYATTAPASADYVVDKLIVEHLTLTSASARNWRGNYQARAVLFHDVTGPIVFGSSKATENAYSAASMTRAYGLFADGFFVSESSSDLSPLGTTTAGPLYNIFPDFSVRVAVLGVTLDKGGSAADAGGHNLRNDTCSRIFVGHSKFTNAPRTTHHISVRSKGRMPWTNALTGIASGGSLLGESRYTVIADNLIGAAGENIVWRMGVSPTTASQNEAISDAVVERNTFFTSSYGGTKRDIVFGGIRLTARDNTLVHGEGRQSDAQLIDGIGQDASYTGPYYFQSKSLTLSDEYRSDAGIIPDKAGTP